MNRPAPTLDRPILLVGLPGVGKSTIAPLLAARLGVPCHDSDALVEAEAGRSIAEIFRDDGEAGFRARERHILERLLAGPPAVIAIGGGALLDPDCRALALARATMVWLDTDPDILVDRLGEARDRPLLAGDIRARLVALKAARDPFYALAPIRVDAARAPAVMVAVVLAALAEPVR